MKIQGSRAWAVRIPLRTPFPHNLSVRKVTESIIIQLQDDRGFFGFGEGAPRPYVTGESLSSCMAFIKNTLFPWLARQNWPDHINSRNEMLQWMQEFHHRFPQRKEDPIQPILAFVNVHITREAPLLLSIELFDFLCRKERRYAS